MTECVPEPPGIPSRHRSCRSSYIHRSACHGTMGGGGTGVSKAGHRRGRRRSSALAKATGAKEQSVSSIFLLRLHHAQACRACGSGGPCIHTAFAFPASTRPLTIYLPTLHSSLRCLRYLGTHTRQTATLSNSDRTKSIYIHHKNTSGDPMPTETRPRNNQQSRQSTTAGH